MFRCIGLLVTATVSLFAIEKSATLPGEIRGAALHGSSLYTWGTELSVWSLPDLTRRILAPGIFGEGGCLVDLDNNGLPEFVSYEGTGLGHLTIRQAPTWRPETIDSQIEMHDCREATLFGRRGILMVNRGMQVRFYEQPATPVEHWPYREIYSFYTASYQGDLVLRDIDKDGFVDILCGNYWIKSPEHFNLPWRLFAINTHHETPESAMVRFAPLSDGRLWIVQSHLENARAMLFSPPHDPKQIWQETLHGEHMILTKLHGVALLGDELIAGENNGSKSRILSFRPGKPTEVLLTGVDVLQLIPMPASRLLIIGPKSIAIWPYRPRK